MTRPATIGPTSRWLPDAERWRNALRGAVVDLVVPRVLDDKKIPAGLSPPGGITRWSADKVPKLTKLLEGLDLLFDRALLDQHTPGAVLLGARRRLIDAATAPKPR